ncbi:MAG: TMEM175 family protein [Planctomycetaceae bacterium]
MQKGRLEAFSDGVLAIIITIMVLELKVPHGDSLSSLMPLWPVFVSYVLSFLYVAIYWNNHHHMLQASHRINGLVLWANMHLLFWLSLVPFVTGWMGENHFAPCPTTLYGVVLAMSGMAYRLLQRALIREHGTDSALARAVGADWKGKWSVLLYVVGVVLSLKYPYLGGAMYLLVALLWLIPDTRIERAMATESGHR